MSDSLPEDSAPVHQGGGWNFAGEHVSHLLDDCSRMLEYATDKGIDIDPPSIENIAAAREAFARGNWNAQHEALLYAAKSALSKAIRPVTLETLAPDTILDAKAVTRFYFRLTIYLVIFIVPISMAVFMDSNLSVKGKNLIEENDKVALVIHNELQNYRKDIIRAEIGISGSSEAAAPTPHSKQADAPKLASGSAQAQDAASASAATSASAVVAIKDLELSETPTALELKENLQDFARNNRQLYAETLWLVRLTLHGSDNVYQSPWMLTGPTQRENLELALPILAKPEYVKTGELIYNPYALQKPVIPEDAIDDGMQKLAVYQDIRAMAQNAERTSDIFWGAITSYLLPVLYSVLGALAFILRESVDQNFKKTFDPEYSRFANRTRLITAVIVGAVIGLFNGLWTTSIASASPLAVAFLAGYAADTFFSFLDKAAASRRDQSS
ncbi:hypothetical protein SAMN05414139_05640 [Burkholderia sp. D7]|nr:hypothetical protein SAMN05414139_05640 [Burkholderia sp. D7]